MSASKPWFQDFFREFRPFFDLVPAKTTNQQVQYLMKKLNLKRGSSFLDCPCGIGRISVPLARQGIKLVGVDLCQEYLVELAEKSKRARLNLELHHADMRKINFVNRFDGAGNLWTSFGYFENERDHQTVLDRAFRALKPGGKFCLHVINRDWILANYTTRGFGESGGVLYTESRHFEFETSINRGVWTFYRDGKPHTFNGDIRMFALHELIAMFKKAGFVDIQSSGSTKDDPVKLSDMMVWLFGTKPKSRARKK
jgi:ubiquinone/menaquinone biosynthesis C-methylase UbiE